jgi:hypothetical protein
MADRLMADRRMLGERPFEADSGRRRLIHLSAPTLNELSTLKVEDMEDPHAGVRRLLMESGIEVSIARKQPEK